MARGKRFKKKGKRPRKEEGDETMKKARLGDFKNLDEVREKFHPAFMQYYKELQIIKDDEWDAFHKVACTDLPVTFRINSQSYDCNFTNNMLLTKYSTGYPIEFTDLRHHGTTSQHVIEKPPRHIEWYPDNNAFRLDTTARVLKKCPELKPLHQLLVGLAQFGSITRQEEVSMIPVQFLDIQPTDNVADLCASPGSKTSQIVEFLNNKSLGFHQGLILANDVDYGRCHKLIHNINRNVMQSIIFTNTIGQGVPNLISYQPSNDELGLFDKVLADVPCTGDGTMRKTIESWTKWTNNGAIGLHNVQLQIAKRAVLLLRKGGRLVYSTCSLNPLENEAVVMSLLKEYGDDIELLDCSHMHPKLIRRPGIDHWKVQVQFKDEATKKPIATEWFNTMLEYTQYVDSKDDLTLKGQTPVVETMFPDGSAEEMKRYNLHRCMRLVPHDQNTGGFFVAVIQKNGGAKTNSEMKREKFISDGSYHIPSARAEAAAEADPTKRNRIHESYHRPKMIDAEVWKQVADYYGIVDVKDGGTFPGAELLYTSGDEKNPKTIVKVSPALKKYVLDAPNYGKMRIIQFGCTVLRKNERKGEKGCTYRLLQQGLHYLLPHITKRILRLSMREFELLFRYSAHKLAADNRHRDFCQRNPGLPIRLLDAATQAAMPGMGNLVVKLDETADRRYRELFGHAEDDTLHPMAFTAWVGYKTVYIMYAKQELQFYTKVFRQIKMFADNSDIEDSIDGELDVEDPPKPDAKP